jgi:hypothetical protein
VSRYSGEDKRFFRFVHLLNVGIRSERRRYPAHCEHGEDWAMAAAAFLSLEEGRDTRRRGDIRQRLHKRFDQWMDWRRVGVKASQPTLEELTQVVCALRQDRS